jgi:hypothetical protein
VALTAKAMSALLVTVHLSTLTFDGPSRCSKTTTSCPAFVRVYAQANPAKDAPTIRMRRRWGAIGALATMLTLWGKARDFGELCVVVLSKRAVKDACSLDVADAIQFEQPARCTNHSPHVIIPVSSRLD